jgi:hypothetical protein
MYRVVVIGRYGFTDVLADFDTREEAERFVRKVKELDPEVNLEVVEVIGYGFPTAVVVASIVCVALIPLLMSLFREGYHVV